jgi:cysteine-S-conjugate beta-lyase
MRNSHSLVPLTESELHVRRSLKWSRAGPGLVPVDVAEADFAVAEPIREALVTAVIRSDLGYPDFDSARGGPQRLAEVFADRMRSKFDVLVDPGRVEVCAQVMQALCCAILAFSRPGDRVLVHEPTYPPILRSIESLGRRAMVVPVAGEVGEEIPAPEALMPAERIAVIVLCNPHNPTGRQFGAGQLAALAALAARHGSVIFADEIHHDMTYETSHRSIAALDGAAERTIVFTSAAKSFNIPGLRCAVGHFGSSALLRRFRELPWHLRSGAGILGIEATIAAWSACELWLDAFRRQLYRNRELVSNAILACDYGYTPPEATYFAWLDLRGTRSDPIGHLRKEQKMLLQDGTVFGPGYSGFARLNFATPESRLGDVLFRLVQILPAIGFDHRLLLIRALTGGTQR